MDFQEHHIHLHDPKGFGQLNMGCLGQLELAHRLL